MDKKRRNPFAEKTNLKKPNSEDLGKMSLEELTQELKAMERAVGKEKFSQLVEEAIRKFENSEEALATDDEFKDENGNLYDFDLVTTTEWSETHPANLVCGSDKYYADLANDLTDIICEFTLPRNIPDNFVRELGRVLAAYLEDIVSETKVFSAMRRVCKERYGYPLPFYDCAHPDYITDHINEEDIRFLIWKTACQLGKEKEMTYSPLAPGWALISDRIFDELNSRYEEAPEARRVSDWLRKSFRKQDYIDIREIAHWLVSRNPLTYFPGFLDNIEKGIDLAFMDESYDTTHLAHITYGYMASESWQRSMSPMGCPSRTLIAAIAAEFGHEALAEDIEAIEVLPRQIYAISQNKKSRQIFFETSTHEKFEVQRDSFAKGFRPDAIQYAECNLLKFKGKYLLNGSLSGNPALKSHWEGQHSFLTFEQQREQAKEWIEILDGQQVVCVSDIKKFLKKIDMPAGNASDAPDAKNFVVLLSEELGVAFLPDMGYAFDLPGNHFYRKRAAAKDSFGDVIFHNSMPHDTAMYIQKHNLLPEACIGASQGKETGRQIVQDYLAFWIGFYCDLPAYGNAPEINIDEGELKK